MNALNSSIVFFMVRTEVVEEKASQNKAFRIGGMAKEESIHHNNLTLHFTNTDTAKEVPALYTGIPALFKEGKGAVAQGRIDLDGTFAATKILSKHDEKLHALRHSMPLMRKTRNDG